MLLHMPCPTKRKGSDNWYFRRTIPSDVQRILAKLSPEKRPRNWYKTHIAISLGTADRAAAKAKCSEVAAAVERQLKALREGPRPLTVKQISGLSGQAYRAFAEGLEADPVLSVAQWRDIADGNKKIAQGKGTTAALGIGDRAKLRRADLERAFGRITDTILAKHNIVTDEDSRQRLIERLATDLPQAAMKLAHNADGNFSPDTYVARFPSPTDAQPTTPTQHSLRGMADAWQAAAITRGVKSAKQIRNAALRFIEWLPHDDARRVTKADVLRWADERMKAGIKASTINKADLASVKSVLAWGADRGWLPATPLDRRTHVESRSKRKVRNSYFSAEEAAAILKAALVVTPGPRENTKTAAAKRWVPWLCAYSGARVTEMIQLRKGDVCQEDGAWVISLTPDAGSIKTNEFRVVPLHEHLIAIGFLEFLKQSRDGYLFCNPRPDGSVRGPIEGVYNRLRVFVRSVIKDRNVQPNHAWRYTFETRGLESGLAERTLYAISGHSARSIGERYMQATLKARVEAIKRFPRYALA